jgi:hypothetical protein
VVLLWGRHLATWSLAIDEHSGHEGLRGSGHRSVIPYVHGRTELYCPSLYEPEPFLFLTSWKWHLPWKKKIFEPILPWKKKITLDYPKPLIHIV